MDKEAFGWLLFVAALCWPVILFYGVRRQEKRLNKRFGVDSHVCKPLLVGNVMSGPTTSWALWQCPSCNRITTGTRV